MPIITLIYNSTNGRVEHVKTDSLAFILDKILISISYTPNPHPLLYGPGPNIVYWLSNTWYILWYCKCCFSLIFLQVYQPRVDNLYKSKKSIFSMETDVEESQCISIVCLFPPKTMKKITVCTRQCFINIFLCITCAYVLMNVWYQQSIRIVNFCFMQN